MIEGDTDLDQVTQVQYTCLSLSLTTWMASLAQRVGLGGEKR